MAGEAGGEAGAPAAPGKVVASRVYSAMPLDPKKLCNNRKACPCIDRVDTDAPGPVVGSRLYSTMIRDPKKSCNNHKVCPCIDRVDTDAPGAGGTEQLGLQWLVALPGARVGIGCTARCSRVASSALGARVARY